MSNTRLIFGCGYLGSRVAARWLVLGDRVHVVTRCAERAAQLRQKGYAPIVANVTDAASLIHLPKAESVLFAVGFDRTAGPTIHQVYADGFRNVLASLSNATERIVYISTTGVYGPANGDWVDETTPPNPQRDGGQASLAAERLLRECPFADRGVVLRLAGLYGPGRIPYMDQLRAGEPIAAPEQGWLNLIHVDDAAMTVLAACDHRSPPAVVCVSDGNPPQRGEYYREVARQLEAPPVRFCEPRAGSPKAARAAADKRVQNGLLLGSLGVQLAFSSYREGISSVISGVISGR